MKNLHRLFATASVIALLGAGCGATPAAPAVPSGAVPTPATPGATARVTGSCSSEYYPLKEGSSILYTSRMSGSDVPYKISVLENDGTNIKLDYEITVKNKVSHITQELICENGTIKGKGYFDFASAFTGLDFTYDVMEMKGEIFPSDFRIGKEWNTSTKVKINTSDTGPLGSMMNGMIASTSIENKVLAEEQITVPAGTYKAVKVEQSITMDQTIGSRPVHTVTKNYVWYVKDVGMVKMESKNAGVVSTTVAKTIVN